MAVDGDDNDNVDNNNNANDIDDDDDANQPVCFWRKHHRPTDGMIMPTGGLFFYTLAPA